MVGEGAIKKGLDLPHHCNESAVPRMQSLSVVIQDSNCETTEDHAAS